MKQGQGGDTSEGDAAVGGTNSCHSELRDSNRREASSEGAKGEVSAKNFKCTPAPRGASSEGARERGRSSEGAKERAASFEAAIDAVIDGTGPCHPE